MCKYASDTWVAITPGAAAPDPLPDNPYHLLMVGGDGTPGTVVLYDRKGVEQPPMYVKAGEQYLVTFSGAKNTGTATNLIAGRLTDTI